MKKLFIALFTMCSIFCLCLGLFACGGISPSTCDHQFGEYQFQNNATCVKDGTEIATCQKCGTPDEKIVEGSKVDHQYGINNKCKWYNECKSEWKYTNDLIFELGSDGQSYYVAGIKKANSVIVLPYGYKNKPVTAIGPSAFDGDALLSTVILTDNVTEVMNNAFRGCVQLTKLELGNGVTSLGQGSFRGCSSLMNMTVPKSTKNIDIDAFSECPSLKKVSISDLTTWCKIDFGGEFSNPLSNGAHLFINSEEIKVLYIPQEISAVKAYAFNGCDGITNVIIPNSVLNIERCSFENCSSLSGIDLPENLNNIGEDAFTDTAYYDNATNWVDNVLYIEQFLIKARTIVSGTYNIREGTTLIADIAFGHCYGLEEVNFPDSTKIIGDRAFYECRSLTNASLTNGLQQIGDGAFYNCGSLINIFIPDGVVYIGIGAFSSCGSAQTLSIGKNVATIGTAAFSACNSLASIEVDANNKNYYSDGNCLMTKAHKLILGCKTSIIPAQVKEIGDRAFWGCLELSSIIIPDGVSVIGEYAFANCNILNSVLIGSGVSSIQAYAFLNTALEKIYYKGTPYEKEHLYINNDNAALLSPTIKWYFYSAKAPIVQQWNMSEYWWHEVNGQTMIWDKAT